MVELDLSKRGRGRSSVTVDKNLRRYIDDLKEELEKTLGSTITDIDVMYHILKNYDIGSSFLTIAKEIIEKTQELIINVEDYEKLKQENEELRKEIEILKERANEYRVPEEPKEIFNLFIKSILKKIPEERRREVERSLRMLQFAIFDGGINVDLLERLGDHVDELVLTIRTGRSSKDSDESELRGGIQLW